MCTGSRLKTLLLWEVQLAVVWRWTDNSSEGLDLLYHTSTSSAKPAMTSGEQRKLKKPVKTHTLEVTKCSYICVACR